MDNSSSPCLFPVSPPQDFCSSIHGAPHFFKRALKVLRTKAQDFFCLRKSKHKCGSRTPWQAEKGLVPGLRGSQLLLCGLGPQFWHCASTARASVPLQSPKEMSVMQPKDRGGLWGWEPSRVTWFHAVSLIFCLASEIYFTRRWERTWNKIDLGWANIWQCSVGNNHLSWEISTPGDIDGTKNIRLNPQSQSI